MKANLYLLIISIIFLINLNAGAQDSLSYIVIRDAPDGEGKEVEKWIRSEDGSIRLYCAGYDISGNFVGNISVSWTVSLDSGNLIISPAENSDSLLVLQEGPALRIDNVRAYYSDLNLQDTTGVLYLVDISLHYIQIRTAPDGGGNEIHTLTMTDDDSITLYAASYDSSDNFIQNQIVDWSTTGTLYSVSTIDTALVFSPPNDPCMSPALGTIVATAGDLSYATGTIQVMRCGVCYIKIRSAPHGGGAEVATVTMTTDDSLTLYAAGYDGDDNYIDDYTAKWTLTGSLDQPGAIETVFVFSPTTAPTAGSIIATVDNMSDATGTIIVSPGEPCYIIIRGTPCNGVIIFPNDNNVCLPEYDDTTTAYIGEHLTLWAGEYDCDGNYRSDVNFLIDSTVVELTGTLKAELSAISLMFTGVGQGRIILNGTDTSGVIIVEEPTSIAKNHIPLKYELKQAYPNPFNPMTRIAFTLPGPEFVTLTVYNILGKEVATLLDGNLRAGNHAYEFDGSGLASGIYVYRIETAKFKDMRKMILIK